MATLHVRFVLKSGGKADIEVLSRGELARKAKIQEALERLQNVEA